MVQQFPHVFTRGTHTKVYHPWARPVFPDSLRQLDDAIAKKMSELLEAELEHDIANHERDMSDSTSSSTTESVRREFPSFLPCFCDILLILHYSHWPRENPV